MKQRTGKECRMMGCKNYPSYSNWLHHMGRGALNECMECKYAHVSQFQRPVQEKGEGKS